MSGSDKSEQLPILPHQSVADAHDLAEHHFGGSVMPMAVVLGFRHLLSTPSVPSSSGVVATIWGG
jgi:hypothetical protein